jgi:hypothetical protein
MDEPINSLLHEPQRLATEDAPSQVGQEFAQAPSEAPAKPPAMPLPRNVRGRRY